MTPRPTVAVLGGGISGLSAAHRLATASDAAVVVVEASDRLGGWLRSGTVAGIELDVGPESLLARVPWGRELLGELGLIDEAVPTAALPAHVWVRGALRPLPPGLMTGTADTATIRRSGLLTRRGQARAALDLVLPGRPPPGDESIADALGSRLGAEAVRAIAEPLFGGIYAGSTERLGCAAAAPAIAAARRRGGSLIRALRASAPAAVDDGPVFLSLPGGLARRLPAAVADALAAAGAEIRLGTPATAIAPRDGRFEIALDGGERLVADAVVVAVPARATAALIAPHSPDAAASVSSIPCATVAVATFAFNRAELPPLPASSGFLVAPGERPAISACTLTSVKWPHLPADGPLLLRCSIGRAGAPPPPDDDEILRLARRDLETTLGIAADPADVRVDRFPESLPQHEVGHLEKITAIERQVATTLPGVALAGAWMRGLGLAACCRDGRAAAERAMMSL